MHALRRDETSRSGGRHSPRFATLLLAATLSPACARAECDATHARAGRLEGPHFALHFGDGIDVPSHLQTTAPLDKGAPSLCVPMYAYNLGAGADAFDLALRTPGAPLGFEAAPGILADMAVLAEEEGILVDLHLTCDAPLCGPALLGCLRLETASLPDRFTIELVPNRDSGRRAAHLENGWFAAQVDAGGASIGAPSPCPMAAVNSHVSDLQIARGEARGHVDLSWKSGSGNYTMLRCRKDGRFPAHLADGSLVALLPSGLESCAYEFDAPAEARFAAWSITTKDGSGELLAGSALECGSLAAITIDLPVAAAPRGWGTVKSLYR
jgi:hypothetical protein